MALYWPQGWKKNAIQFGSPWGQCFSIYYNNLGPNNKPLGANVQLKNAQSWPQDFLGRDF
jgi:hypothetical protein